MKDFRIFFYKFKKFGYYIRNGKHKEFMFGEQKEAFIDLVNWLNKRSLSTTKIIDKESNIYCNGILNHNNCFTMMLWQEFNSSNSGKLYSLDKNAIAGETAPEIQQIDQNIIPGIPGYFWIDTNLNVIAVIKPSNCKSLGISLLEEFLLDFISYKWSKHVKIEFLEGNRDNISIKYRKSQGMEEVHGVQACVKTIIHPKGDNKEFLLNNVNNIRQLALKSRITRTLFEGRQSLLTQIKNLTWNFLTGSSKTSEHVKELKIQIKSPINKEDLELMLNKVDNSKGSSLNFEVCLNGKSNWYSLNKVYKITCPFDFDEDKLLSLTEIQSFIIKNIDEFENPRLGD
ncbi:hypothetical protein QEJ31_02790 [Pigmentibacter sp. JX0631]|uniref:hypothetical protein n=1 Tax=Pigmentibacter sp. JX0631 TaxID=2976982 RepID=UPI00246989A4|nr:hypothetical protein [Pigmentibacter sp. JX0631]WGL60527.1 hypothetical protein QEJ31_02790 [Pigmentibacter sp. JX0631]